MRTAIRPLLTLVFSAVLGTLAALSACGTGAPPICQPAGGACSGFGDCCGGLACDVTKGRCEAPTCAGQGCVNSAGCCAGNTCARIGHTCHAAANLGLGDACSLNSQCASGQCSDYCTRTCGSRNECGSGMYCLQSATGNVCVPACQFNTDCTVYGAGITCQQASDPSGVMLPGCFSQ